MKNTILILAAVMISSISAAQSITAGYSAKNNDPAAQGVTATYCQGEVTSFSFNSSGFNPGNIFTVQMSDATGAFTSPIAIGSAPGDVGLQIVSVTIPISTPPGSNYAFRVTGTSPPYVSGTLWADNAIAASSTYYADVDSDGYGDPLVSEFTCTPPAGFVLDNSDCNDADNQMHQTFPFYVDGDGDSYGTGAPVAVCAVNSFTPPAGYANNDADCNDADGSMHFEYFFYVDSDGDTYGTGSLVSVCAVNATTAPAGYSVNNTDCNDADSTVFQIDHFFVDADNDGYTTGVIEDVCYGNTVPSGYTLTNIGIDCNDFVASIYPGAPEILFNGVDDNCDGMLDEGQQLFSQVIVSQCGTTLTSIGSIIYAVNQNNSTQYRFEVTNTSDGTIQVIERPVRWFNLTMLAAHDYATTYSVRCELQRNGIWLGYYGPSCLLSSPAILDPGPGGAQVGDAQCGSVLPTIGTIIMTNSIPNSTGYRFRVTNLTDPAAPNQVQVLDRSLRWFSLPMLASYHYGTTYMIEVAVKTNGDYTGFGDACFITTPAVPALTNCSQVVANANTIVATQSKQNAMSYRFQLTNLGTGVITTIIRPLHWFRFSMFPAYEPGQQYDVQVAVMTSGYFSLYGDACTITAPPASRFDDIKGDVKAAIAFKAIAYPNPYTEAFTVDLATANDQPINVSIYDMMGKLIEVREVAAAELNGGFFGQTYPSGLYNVIISQGDQVKSLRVIKR